MSLILCELKKAQKHAFFVANLKTLKKDELNFSDLKISGNMDFIFCKPKKLKNHELNFLQACKRSQNVSLIFCNLQNAQNRRIESFQV